MESSLELRSWSLIKCKSMAQINVFTQSTWAQEVSSTVSPLTEDLWSKEPEKKWINTKPCTASNAQDQFWLTEWPWSSKWAQFTPLIDLSAPLLFSQTTTWWRDFNFTWSSHQALATNTTDAPLAEEDNWPETKLKRLVSKTWPSRRPYQRSPRSCYKPKTK